MMNTTHFTAKKHYPWVVITLCAFFLFYKYILQTYPGLITDDLQRKFSLSATGLGHLAAATFYSYTIMQLFVGTWFAKVFWSNPFLSGKYRERKTAYLCHGLSTL